jgi:integrase
MHKIGGNLMCQKKDPVTKKWWYEGKYTDENGNRKSYKKRGFRTKSEAKKAEHIFLEKLKTGQQKPESQRLKLYTIIDLYNKEAPYYVKASSLKSYKRFERDYIIPKFGNRLADTITTKEIEIWLNNILLNGYNGKTYSYSTIRNLWLHLSGIYTFAEKNDYVFKNPCRGIKLQKNPNEIARKNNAEDNYWEYDEYIKFINSVQDDYRKDLYEFMFYTGLRIGEFCALQWEDVNLESKTLRINKSLSHIVSKITSPKTETSYRTITLPNKIVEKLKIRYKYVSKIDGFNKKYFLFKDSTYISISTFSRWFQEDLANSDVKRITVHGLRHSHASFLLNNPDIPEGLIAERMGHTVDMLKSTYSHIYKAKRNMMTQYIDNL